MSTLLVILSHAEADHLVRMCFDNYRIPGWDILGCCPSDSKHSWPNGTTHVATFGRAGYSTPDLIRRWVEAWAISLAMGYDNICMIEPDGVFTRKPPEHPGGLFTHLTGGGYPGFKATRYYHTPWWADRPTANVIFRAGCQLMAEGEFEHGSPDFFLGLITERNPEIVVHETNTWSCNGGDMERRWEEARVAIEAGAWYAHGLRTRQDLDRINEAAKALRPVPK